MKIAAVMGCVLFLLTASAHGFPRLTPTWTLAEQYGRARLVVVARGEGEAVDVSDSLRGKPNRRTKFTILRKLKGPADVPQEIVVETFVGGGCPYGPSFTEKRNYLLYLQLSKPGHFYEVVDYGSGYRQVDDRDAAAYAPQFAELEEIWKLPAGEGRRKRFVEFYFNCALHPVTRSDGLYGLNRLPESTPEVPWFEMSDARRTLLASVLIRERPPTYESTSISALFLGHPNADVDDYFIEALRHADDKHWYDILEDAVDRLPGRLRFQVPKNLQARWEKNFDQTRGLRRIDDRYIQLRLSGERVALAEEFLKLVEAARRLQR